MSDIVFANAEVVTADRVFRGHVAVADGRIVEVGEGDAVPAGAIDFAGDYLMPGLVELHTDNVEKHMTPRPGVIWPSPVAAILAHDAQMTAAGVTTVYDAISVGAYMNKNHRRELLPVIVGAVSTARREGLFRADHLMHLRLEVADDAVMELFGVHADDPIVGMISVMDHTPGQRQWRDLKSFRTYQNAQMSDEEFEKFIAERIAATSKHTDRNRKEVLKRWAERGPVASHDDTTLEHVEEAVADGIRISEFPTTMQAAEAAKAAGMTTVMGAPNVVRGGSHSGNVSAIELAEAGLLDALSSDYAPISLIHAVFSLNEAVGLSLPDAVATVSRNPARMLGHEDRGEIAEGRRADILRVRRLKTAPIVSGVWVQGEQKA